MMTVRRRREAAESAAATQRLAAVGRRSAGRPVAPGEQSAAGFGWFHPPTGGEPAESQHWDFAGPVDGAVDGSVDGAVDGSVHRSFDGVHGPAADPPEPYRGSPSGRQPGPLPVAERLRGYAADRVPLALRGAAGVPVTAAVAVLLVVVAVVVGVLVRAQAGQPQVVEVGRPRSGVTAGSAETATAGRSAASEVGAAGPAATRAGSGAAGSGGTGSGGTGSGATGSGAAGSGGTDSGAAGPATTGPPAVVVDVVGKVRRPGLVRLPAGSRVADAVAAAGGATRTAALPRINLARFVADGEQVVVPDADDPVPPPPPVAAGGGAASAATGAPAGPLDLNSATASDLDALPGVGPVIAGRIVAWRSEHQRFSRVDELAEVEGIGPKLLERLRPLVAV